MHVNDFPISTPAMVMWFFCLIVAAVFFVRLLNALLRKGRRGWMGLVFGLLLALGTAVHVVILSRSSHTVTDGNWIQLVLTSCVAGLEMFVGHTVVFDDIIAHVRNASMDRKNHIFLGVSHSAKLLAKSILEDWEKSRDTADQGFLIFVDLPDGEGVHAEISLGDIFTNLVSRRKEVGLDEELGSDRFVLLKGHCPVPGHEEDLPDAVGLGDLRPWFHNPRTSIYLLMDDEESNRLMVENLSLDPAVQAKTFCRVDTMDGFNSIYTATQNRLRLVESVW